MAHDTTADGRYGLASGTRYLTLADKEFFAARDDFGYCLTHAGIAVAPVSRRKADRELVEATRRLVRAALDVERQRAFERGVEAFAAMPMVRARHSADGTPNRWTPGTFQGD